MIRESAIERYFVKQVEKRGGRAYKWVSPGNVGVPDRLAVFPFNNILFVELKAKKGRLRAAQTVQMEKLADLGCSTVTIRSKKEVDIILEDFCA